MTAAPLAAPVQRVVLGYDPGGNAKHGVAAIVVDSNFVATANIESDTVATAEDAVSWFGKRLTGPSSALAGVGVDTLTLWSSGPSGLRPADAWLRHQPGLALAADSVVSPNGLRGAMVLNGMTVLLALRATFPNVPITETHPKVLYLQQAGVKWDWGQRARMVPWLEQQVGQKFASAPDEHAWDAAASAWAAACGFGRRWSRDLHQLPTGPGQRLVSPVGQTFFYWP